MKLARVAALATALLSAATAPLAVRADWVNLTGAENAPNIAEIYVEEDSVRIVLEIFIDDVDAFQPLTREEFSAIRLTDGRGRQLELTGIPVLERRLRQDRYSPFRELGTVIPWGIVTQPPEDPRVYYAELTFSFDRRPETLTITPPLAASGLARTNIGMVVFHEGVPVTDFRYLGGAEVLHLDWKDPWYSRFENANLGRHHQAALTSYLYVEPYEVRHEILIRPKDLASWLDLELADPDRVEPPEFRALLTRMAEFLQGRNRVTIDGTAVRPIVDQAEFVSIGMYGVQNVKPVVAMDLDTVVAGIMFSYPTPGLPQEVRMQWDLFNERIEQVPATAIDPAGPFMSYLSPDDDTLVWNNFLQQYRLPEVERVPVRSGQSNWNTVTVVVLIAALALFVWFRARGTGWSRAAGAGLAASIAAGAIVAITTLARELQLRPPQANEATLVLESLLKNVYHAFYLRSDEDVYDKLALTVSGDLLEQVFLQQRQSFAVQSAGGAEAKVATVQLIESRFQADAATADSLTYAARWTAAGAVSHWGHTHDRTNMYDAVITISPADDLWKITGLRILSEKRLEQSVDSLPVGPSSSDAAAVR